MRSAKRVVLDFGLYILISIAVVASLFIATAWHISTAEYMRWVGFFAITLVAFGFVLGENRMLWGNKSFRTLICTIFVGHCLVFTGLQIEKVSLSGAKVMSIIFVEIGLIYLLKKKFVVSS